MKYLAHLSEMSKLYANEENTDVEENHIGKFFGLSLFCGYHTVPGEDLCWSTYEDLSITTVASVYLEPNLEK